VGDLTEGTPVLQRQPKQSPESEQAARLCCCAHADHGPCGTEIATEQFDWATVLLDRGANPSIFAEFEERELHCLATQQRVKPGNLLQDP
jgi:hypothetical protein